MRNRPRYHFVLYKRASSVIYCFQEIKEYIISEEVIGMPRKARQISRTNIYHIMLRGINRQNIFEDEIDYRLFLRILKDTKEKSGIRIHAYCLMSNHVHLLLETGEEPLGDTLKHITIRYAYWYNQRYQRIGHLFQDRYKSERVETEAYFLTVLRYIIQNPMKAGLESKPGLYRWSSYIAYRKGTGSVTDQETALGYFAGREELLAYLKETNDDQAMDDTEPRYGISDDQARAVMEEVCQCKSVPDFQRLDKVARLRHVQAMKKAGVSLRQLALMTGISKSTISRWVEM